MEEAAQQTQQEASATAPAKKSAPAICVVGASGAGKTTQILSLAPAVKAAGLKMIVACFDSGSVQAYEVGDGFELLPDDKLGSLSDLCDKYPPSEFLLIVDTWRAYEERSVAWYKRQKKASQLTLKDWNTIVGGWNDDIVRIYSRRNAIMTCQVSTGMTPVPGVDGEGRPIKQLLPPGQLVCTESLKKEGPKLVQAAPVVLPLSSGGEKGERAWAPHIGQAQRKFIRRGVDGKISMALPGAQESDRLIPVSVCSLGDIWTSLLR